MTAKNNVLSSKHPSDFLQHGDIVTLLIATTNLRCRCSNPAVVENNISKPINRAGSLVIHPDDSLLLL